MKRFARVTAVRPEKIEAILEQPLTCAGCRGGCGKTALKWFSANKPDQLIIYRQAHAQKAGQSLVDHQGFFNGPVQVGDRFAVEFDDDAMLLSAWRLYAMPLAVLLVGLVIFSGLFSLVGWPFDLGGVLGAIVGLFLSRFIIRHYPSAGSIRFSSVNFF